LDNYDHYRLVLSDIVGFFSRYPEKVIIDEAQLLPDICSVLRQLIESGSQEVSHIILISSARLRSPTKTEPTTGEATTDGSTTDDSITDKSKQPGCTSFKIRNIEPKNSKLRTFELKNPDLGNSELRNLELETAGLNQSEEIPDIELWPFKMTEYYSQELPQIYEVLLKNQTQPEDFLQLRGTLTLQEVYEHWFYGSFPQPRISCRENASFQNYWMDEYLITHLRKDIQNQFPRLNYQKFYLFIAASLQHSGSLINHSRIARSLDLSSVTVQHYFEILQQTGVWRGLSSFNKSAAKTLRKAPKGYFRDSGILNHHLKVKDVDQLLVHPQANAGFESFAVEELISGIQCKSRQTCKFSHLRTKDGSEISLIIETSQKIIPILIQLGRRIDKRKLRAIQDFVQENNCSFGLLVNSASTIEVLHGNIVQIPVNCI